MPKYDIILQQHVTMLLLRNHFVPISILFYKANSYSCHCDDIINAFAMFTSRSTNDWFLYRRIGGWRESLPARINIKSGPPFTVHFTRHRLHPH
jgi:hypothetical protein